MACLATGLAFGAGEQLDSTFDGNGRQTTDVSALADFIEALAIADGKIAAAGGTTVPLAFSHDEDDFAVARYDADGDVDWTATTDFHGMGDVANGVAIQDDGKVVAGGKSSNPDDVVPGVNEVAGFAVARYTTTGAPDPGFGGGDGMVETVTGSPRFPPGDPYREGGEAWDVAITPNDKIVAAGTTYITRDGVNEPDIGVVRYSSSGTEDNSWGGDGIVTTDLAGLTTGEGGSAVAVQPDGKVVVAGYVADTNGTVDAIVLRYEEDGDLDSSFSGDGVQTVDFGSQADTFEDVTIEADGQIVAAGHTFDAAGVDEEFAVARLNSNGGLDTSFDGDGRKTIEMGPNSPPDEASGVASHPDGRIVVSGISGANFAAVRLTPSGALNSAKVVAPFFNEYGAHVAPGAMALQPDGKVVLGGALTPEEGGQSIQFGLLRYSSLGVPPDETPPATTITRLVVNSNKGKARVRFTGSDRGQPQSHPITFRCRLDGRGYTPCSSPKLYRNLRAGRHKIRVRARDKAGNLDPTPASRTFRIMRP